MSDPIARLEELMEKATKASERLEAALNERSAAAAKTNEAFGIAAWARAGAAYDEAYDVHYWVDADLSAALRNAAPALLAVAKCAARARAEQIQREKDEDEYCAAGQTISYLQHCVTLAELDKALAALQRLGQPEGANP